MAKITIRDNEVRVGAPYDVLADGTKIGELRRVPETGTGSGWIIDLAGKGKTPAPTMKAAIDKIQKMV